MANPRKIKVIPADDNQCAWYEVLASDVPYSQLHGTQSFDIAVIGAGYTGLSAARRLGELMPQKRIALIEAQRVGIGSAGRSSGFAIDLAHDVRSKNLLAGLEETGRQTRFNRAGLAYLKEAVDQHGIDCDWDSAGKIHAAATPNGHKKLVEFTQVLDKLNEPYRWLSSAEMAEMTGSPFYIGGVFAPGTVLVQPAAMVQGLSQHLPENVTLFEKTPVTDVKYGQRIRLITPGGEIDTCQLLLANNGYAQYFGFYQHHLIPFMTYGSMTRPLTARELADLGGMDTWGVIPADAFGSSLRKTRDNRILVRHTYSYADRFMASPRKLKQMRSEHRLSFDRRFPQLAQAEFEYTWGGALCLSRNGAPVFGELTKNVFGAFCMNGVGITRGTIMGKLIAEQMAGQSSELLAMMQAYPRPNRNPPDFMMKLGVGYELARRARSAGLEK